MSPLLLNLPPKESYFSFHHCFCYAQRYGNKILMGFPSIRLFKTDWADWQVGKHGSRLHTAVRAAKMQRVSGCDARCELGEAEPGATAGKPIRIWTRTCLPDAQRLLRNRILISAGRDWRQFLGTSGPLSRMEKKAGIGFVPGRSSQLGKSKKYQCNAISTLKIKMLYKAKMIREFWT